MPLTLPGPLVTTNWLADPLHDDNLVLLGGSCCGSGVTAGALAFAHHLIGKSDVSVHDGSWSERGLPGEVPVATGPARLAFDA